MSLVVLVPTLGRGPSAMDGLAASFGETRDLPTTRLAFVVEPDDPISHHQSDGTITHRLAAPRHTGMSAAVNEAYPSFPDAAILGVLGDDNRFRSAGWDASITDALAQRTGIVYGDDGVQGEALPTAWFVSRAIVDAVGWLANPECHHFYLDNSWQEIGKALGIIRYLPEVKIEHLHYSFGKSELDPTYRHTLEVGAGDDARFSAWLSSSRFQRDVGLIRRVVDGGNR